MHAKCQISLLQSSLSYSDFINCWWKRHNSVCQVTYNYVLTAKFRNGKRHEFAHNLILISMMSPVYLVSSGLLSCFFVRWARACFLSREATEIDVKATNVYKSLCLKHTVGETSSTVDILVTSGYNPFYTLFNYFIFDFNVTFEGVCSQADF